MSPRTITSNIETAQYVDAGEVVAVNAYTLMSAKIESLAGALALAQPELESVNKGERGYGYNYASLPDTIQVAKPVLAKHKLSVSQLVGNDINGNPSVTTILMHSSGQWIQSTASMKLVEMKGCNEAQRAGAVYTYLRRYALQGILNMSSEDNDASSEGFKSKAGSTSFGGKSSASSATASEASAQDKVTTTAAAPTTNTNGQATGAKPQKFRRPVANGAAATKATNDLI